MGIARNFETSTASGSGVGTRVPPDQLMRQNLQPSVKPKGVASCRCQNPRNYPSRAFLFLRLVLHKVYAIASCTWYLSLNVSGDICETCLDYVNRGRLEGGWREDLLSFGEQSWSPPLLCQINLLSTVTDPFSRYFWAPLTAHTQFGGNFTSPRL